MTKKLDQLKAFGWFALGFCFITCILVWVLWGWLAWQILTQTIQVMSLH